MTKDTFVNKLQKTFGPPSNPIYILSSHLDDAVWSLGGLIDLLVKANYAVSIVTIFSRSPFIYGKLFPSEKGTKIRKAEDISALKKIGVNKYCYLDFPEALLRDKTHDQIFDKHYLPPRHLLQIIIKQLMDIIPDDALVLAPAAYGEHIDHIIVRLSSTHLPQTIIYYEDLPYASRAVRIADAQSFLCRLKRHEQRIPASDQCLTSHMKLYNSYLSQRKDRHVVEIYAHLRQKGYGLWVH